MRARWLFALLCCALPLAACTSGGERAARQPAAGASSQSTSAARPAPLGTGTATPPRLRWRACGGRFKCATVSVPLDYRQPTARQVRLSVIMLPAANRDSVIGPLFVNFGGPGTPGIGELRDHASRYPPAMRSRFDLIAVDPRGTGASSPLECAASDTAPAGRPSARGFWTAAASVGKACASSPLLDHLSSANTARDMDLIRQAAGADRISYLGYSYGSYLGAVYANLFPSHVRAMTFDGTLDLVANSAGRPGDADQPVDVRADVAGAQRAAMQDFLGRCAAAGDACAFAAGGDPRRKWADLLAATARDGGAPELFDTVFSDLERGASTWTDLAATLQDAYQSASPAGEAARGQPPIRDPYIPTHSAAFLAVQCVDSDIPQRRAAYPPLARQEDRRVPGFGASAVYDMAQCVDWPGADRDWYTGPWNARLAAPVLVVNNRNDPATPLANAKATAGELDRARLLVVDGSGHTTLNVHSACAADATARYFVRLTLPVNGTTCPPDYRPFG